MTGPSRGEAKFLSFCVCFSDDATAAAAAVAVGVDAHCEGGGILPSLPPSLARWRGPPSSARPGRGRSPAEVKKPWRTKNVGDSEDFMRCIMRHNTSSRLSLPVNVVFGVSLHFCPDSGRESKFWSCPPFPSERTADYDINSFARAVLKHKGAFSGGIRRATVIIPRLPPAHPLRRSAPPARPTPPISTTLIPGCARRNAIAVTH